MKNVVCTAVCTSVHIDIRTFVRYVACMVIYTAVCFVHAAVLYAPMNAPACEKNFAYCFMTWSWLLVL